MAHLTDLTTPRRLDDGLFQAEIPDAWQQGRGAFGGLVLANLVRAAMAVDASPERALRSVSATLCAPVLPGPRVIRAERLRTGTGVSTVAVRLEQDGEVAAHAVVVFGKTRLVELERSAVPRPAMPPWRSVAPSPSESAGSPPFARHFEFRPVEGAPFSGGAEARVTGWVRGRDPGPARDAAYLVMLADAYWPSVLVLMQGPRPLATLTFTFDLVDGASGLDPEAPLFHTARSASVRGGYVVEPRELWGEDGRLVAIHQQTLAIIK